MKFYAAQVKRSSSKCEKAGAWPKFHSQLLWRANVSAKFGKSGALSGDDFGFYVFAVVGEKGFRDRLTDLLMSDAPVTARSNSLRGSEPK
ncbi:hypothetical protein ACNKHK_28555 [Shigella flexneri]